MTMMNKDNINKRRDKIINQWINSGLLDNLTSLPDKTDLAEMLEGKAVQLINDEFDLTLYSEIEHLIITWSNDGTKTAGSLTREIMKLINENKNDL